jgi:hypothetical protein
MARDFGGLDRPRWRPGQRGAFVWAMASRVGLLGGFLIFASLPSLLAISSGGPDRGPAKASAFTRPCRPITRAEFERGWTEAPRSFTFEGVTFARRRGDADCQGRRAGLGKGYRPACEFDVPYQLAVTAGGVTSYFAVPPGEAASVETKPGIVRCEVTGRNTLPLS